MPTLEQLSAQASAVASAVEQFNATIASARLAGVKVDLRLNMIAATPIGAPGGTLVQHYEVAADCVLPLPLASGAESSV